MTQAIVRDTPWLEREIEGCHTTAGTVLSKQVGDVRCSEDGVGQTATWSRLSGSVCGR